MSDTDLFVPINVYALPVNRANISNTRSFEESDAGVHVQWQLPEALTDGYEDPARGQTRFPLVPNRWLVTRYHGPANARQAVGWIVHSDFLDNDGPHGARGTARSIALYDSRTGAAATGRRLDQRVGSWVELEPEAPEGALFLTAVGPGLPTFAAYQPYNQDVFSIHDSLVYRNGEPALADGTLSYLVAGWYSDDGVDTLSKSAGVGALLAPDPAEVPPEPARLVGILDALGWQPSGSSQTPRTLYSGSALGVTWQHAAESRS
ncbi:hypothetical protein ABZX95_47650 [Streptomyces sp. NPDC004232]|uniref:hypothetical protein n=1 Tax=Streptomyces sp. NPDC004232 TaxID=3154454 RepID=UPI001DA7A3FF|nr:hypothetical protein [Streptomyces sp. tea 10]